MLRIIICAIGRLKQNAIRDLALEYEKRLCNILGQIGVGGFLVKEISESKENNVTVRRQQEGKKLLAMVNEGSKLIICDQFGENLTSKQIAGKLQNFIICSQGDIIFAIGGADGFSDAVKARADCKLSFGLATFPHQLVRVMLVEQLYRATTIILNHPYHRD